MYSDPKMNNKMKSCTVLCNMHLNYGKKTLLLSRVDIENDNIRYIWSSFGNGFLQVIMESSVQISEFIFLQIEMQIGF